jgi:hypothetical protein
MHRPHTAKLTILAHRQTIGYIVERMTRARNQEKGVLCPPDPLRTGIEGLLTVIPDGLRC